MGRAGKAAGLMATASLPHPGGTAEPLVSLLKPLARQARRMTGPARHRKNGSRWRGAAMTVDRSRNSSPGLAARRPAYETGWPGRFARRSS